MRTFDLLSQGLLSFLAFAGLGFLAAVQAAEPDAEAAGADVKLSLRAAESEIAGSLHLYVTFENAGDQDVVLNLGLMLGNGKILQPEALRVILTDGAGQAKELHFVDKKHPGIAGRVDDYALPLRAGSSFTLKLSLNDFWCPASKEFTLDLKPGRYSARAEFIGRDAQYENGLLLHYWTGKIESDATEFQVGKQG